jgi:transcriptional regulator with XRE-family HTH domain
MILDPQQRATLARHRVRLGLSQAQLGARMGARNTTVCKLEMGHVTLSFEMLQRWCKALGLRPRIIFELDAFTGDGGPAQRAPEPAALTNGQAYPSPSPHGAESESSENEPHPEGARSQS